MTLEELKELNLPISIDNNNLLLVNAGIEWLQDNTTFELNPENIETIKALPSGAMLFLVKFVDVLNKDNGVISESIAGMSQSFSTDSIQKKLYDIGRQLLKRHMNSNVKFLPCLKRWR